MFARPSSSPPELERPDLEKILAHYGVDVYRSGMAQCVFHEDTKPSMSVDLKKGLVHCHACGAGGSSWDVIMNKENLDFRGAGRWAASAALTTEASVAGGSDDHVSGNRYTGGSRVAKGAGHREGRRSFRPSWSRAD